MLKIKYITVCMMTVVALSGCKKDKEYDVKGEEMVKFFTRNETSGNVPANSINFTVVNYPDVASNAWLNLSTTISSEVKFPVFATRPVAQDVEITATLDNSLVAAYNTANNTSYEALPAGILNTDAVMKARILNGQTRSTDSITIPTNFTTLGSLGAKTYMVPIRLQSVSNPAAGEITSSNTRVTYIMVSVEQRRIKYLATAAEALGTLITPRTSWAVTLTPAATSVGGNGSITDGSTTSFSRFGVTPVQVDVNMQGAKNVTGIRLYTSNNATHIPTQVDVFVSNDGINYDLVGSPLRASLTYASSYNYILFYKAISAQYVRLRLSYTTSTNTQNTRVTELDVYAN